MNGYGTERDLKKYFEFLGRSAETGNNYSKSLLGYSYFQGIGTPRNEIIGLGIIKEMMKKKCPGALNIMAIMCLTGLNGNKNNYNKAYNLFNESIRADSYKIYGDAINNLGWCYLHGLGVWQDTLRAVQCFEQARIKGNRCAINNLAWCYLNGLGVKKSLENAARLFSEARKLQLESNAANGFGISCFDTWTFSCELERLEQSALIDERYQLALCYLKGHGVVENATKALSIFSELANNHEHPQAMLKLAMCLSHGVGVDKTPETEKNAFQLFSRVSNLLTLERVSLNENDANTCRRKHDYEQKCQNNDFKIEAWIQLAFCKMYGRGTSKDVNLGDKLLTICCDLGHPAAEFYMGWLLMSGNHPLRLGVKDKINAFKLFTNAADCDHTKAQRYLALFYDLGEVTPRDVKLAMHYYRLAAEKHDPISENNLGTFYEHGDGVEQNTELVLQYYQLSAHWGNYAKGWYNLGRCYELGIGIKPNIVKAIECYEKAANQGHSHSKLALEQLHANETDKESDEKRHVESSYLTSEKEKQISLQSSELFFLQDKPQKSEQSEPTCSKPLPFVTQMRLIRGMTGNTRVLKAKIRVNGRLLESIDLSNARGSYLR